MNFAQQTTNLVKAVEVWGLSDSNDESTLRVQSGIYGELHDLRHVSSEHSLQIGHGLAGRVFETRQPQIISDLFNTQSDRSEVARDFGITTGIGFPCMSNGQVLSVVVFLCEGDSKSQVAFEIWGRNERRELGLRSAHYANLDRFGRISQFVKFPLGAGLPGQVWETRFPLLVKDLRQSQAFMRRSGARVDGLKCGIGLPVMRSKHDLDSTFLILSSHLTPVARVMELWVCDESGECMYLLDGVYENGDECFSKLEHHAKSLQIRDATSLVGRAWKTRLPIASEDLKADDSIRAPFAFHAGLSNSIATPIFAGDEIRAVFVMMN